MIPFLALALPTFLETILVTTATTVVTTVAIRATEDAYNTATKKRKEDDED